MCLVFLAAGVASETFNDDDLDEAGEEWPEDFNIDWDTFKPLTQSNIALDKAGVTSTPAVTNIEGVAGKRQLGAVGAAAGRGAGAGASAGARGITTAVGRSASAGSRAGPKAAGAAAGRNIFGNGGKFAAKASEISKKTI
ncbi:MAG: hypothetical protein Q9202_003380 [Teloschistes flavicans]